MLKLNFFKKVTEYPAFLKYHLDNTLASLVTQMVKNLPATQETQLQTLSQEDPLEKRMAPHSSIIAWRILWTEQSSRLQSIE